MRNNLPYLNGLLHQLNNFPFDCFSLVLYADITRLTIPNELDINLDCVNASKSGSKLDPILFWFGSKLGLLCKRSRGRSVSRPELDLISDISYSYQT